MREYMHTHIHTSSCIYDAKIFTCTTKLAVGLYMYTCIYMYMYMYMWELRLCRCVLRCTVEYSFTQLHATHKLKILAHYDLIWKMVGHAIHGHTVEYMPLCAVGHCLAAFGGS